MPRSHHRRPCALGPKASSCSPVCAGVRLSRPRQSDRESHAQTHSYNQRRLKHRISARIQTRCGVCHLPQGGERSTPTLRVNVSTPVCLSGMERRTRSK
jgi:hypothetical protein